MTTNSQMRSTSWLAQRLGLSVTTIERLRAKNSPDLPPCHTIGKSKRYDERQVEQWLQQVTSSPSATTINESAKNEEPKIQS